MELNIIYLDVSQAIDELNYARELIESGLEEEAKTIIEKVLKEIDKAREKLDKLETKAVRLRGLVEEIEEATKEELGEEEIEEEKEIVGLGEEKEIGEIGKETKEKKELKEKSRKIKYIPEKEAMIVALSRLPTATPRIRMEAERIIRLYNLTEEDIEKLYRTFFE